MTAALIGFAVQYVPITNHAVLVLSVASPYLLCTAPLGILAFLLVRRWVLATVAVAVTIAGVLVNAPLFLGSDPPSDAIGLRVMTANIYLGQADAAVLAATAEANADVLSVQELTPSAVDRLHAAGLDGTFPFRMLDAREGANGGGLWSRYPIVAPEHYDGYKLATVSARIKVAGITVDPTVVVAHLAGPWPQPIDDWVADLHRMSGTLKRLRTANAGSCVIVAGDFNSTPAMKPFRSMLGHEFSDGAEQSGTGYTLTYPGNSRWIPPFMAIDHILTSGCTATSVRVVGLPGSDHRGLVSAISVPVG